MLLVESLGGLWGWVFRLEGGDREVRFKKGKLGIINACRSVQGDMYQTLKTAKLFSVLSQRNLLVS